MLAGSHSIFTPEAIDDTIRQRIATFDVHPTGPLWGAGDLRSTGTVRALEEEVAATLPLFRDGLAAAGLNQERRELRLLVADARSGLARCTQRPYQLPPTAGAYATTAARTGGEQAMRRPAHSRVTERLAWRSRCPG